MPSQADASPSWVFAPDVGAPGSEIVLGPEESHYVARVCRARAGDRIHVTDGRGAVAVVELATVDAIVRGHVEEREEHVCTRRAEVWCGAPEGRRADWLVEKLAELGVAVWQPIECERSRWSAAVARRERWERLATAALRQARRHHLMEIRVPRRLEDVLEAKPPEARGWWGDERGEPPVKAGLHGAALAIGVIGPAQGLSDTEKDRLRAAQFRSISLSDSRLRTETAALAWASWWAGAIL